MWNIYWTILYINWWNSFQIIIWHKIACQRNLPKKILLLIIIEENRNLKINKKKGHLIILKKVKNIIKHMQIRKKKIS